MISIRTSAAAALGVIALAAPAFAQDAMKMGEPMMMESGQAMVMMPAGEMMMGTMTEETMTMAMENAEPVSEDTVFFFMDGQMMMMTGMEVGEDGMMMMPN